MALIVLKFSRLSPQLATLYHILETPLVLVTMLLIVLCFIYSLLSFTAMQLWGAQVPQFRSLRFSFQSLFSMLTLHSPDLDMSLLYRFNNCWPLLFMVLYLVFLQHTFMNIFTSIFLEEYRLALPYPATETTLREFLAALVCCRPKAKAESVQDTSGVDSMKEKMRALVQKRMEKRK